MIDPISPSTFLPGAVNPSTLPVTSSAEGSVQTGQASGYSLCAVASIGGLLAQVQGGASLTGTLIPLVAAGTAVAYNRQGVDGRRAIIAAATTFVSKSMIGLGLYEFLFSDHGRPGLSFAVSAAILAGGTCLLLKKTPQEGPRNNDVVAKASVSTVSSLGEELRSSFSRANDMIALGRKDPSLVEYLSLGQFGGDIFSRIGNVQVEVVGSKSPLPSVCSFDHIDKKIRVFSTAGAVDISRALVSAMIYDAIERNISPNGCVSLANRILLKSAADVDPRVISMATHVIDKSNRPDFVYSELGDGFNRRRLSAKMAYELALMDHPELFEAIISRATKHVGSKRHRFAVWAHDRFLLPLMYYVGYPVLKLARRVNDSLPERMRTADPLTRNLLIAGAKGRRDLKLQERLTNQSLLESFGLI